MGLYLCVFDGDEELDGVEIGPYADFGNLRDFVVNKLEGRVAGSRFPTFILHSDCDGEWSPSECDALKAELTDIISQLKSQSPVPFPSAWQAEVARSVGLSPANAFESFVDVDGEFVLERLLHLVSLAQRRQLPVLFQ